MQPYFFPYSGYFSLIHSVDHFMFFDRVQFNKKSWMMRNRLLNIEKNETYYIRPSLIKSDYLAMLPSVKLDNTEKWKLKILEQMKGYKNKALFYNEVEIFMQFLFKNDYETLVEFNMKSTIEISKLLGLTNTFDKFSDHSFSFEETPGEGDWGRLIAAQVGATKYINSPGGESFIFPKLFNEINIELGFIQPNLNQYDQKTNLFTPGLSILDVLLFNGFELTSELIKDYSIGWKN